jgi:nucleolar protein 56
MDAVLGDIQIADPDLADITPRSVGKQEKKSKDKKEKKEKEGKEEKKEKKEKKDKKRKHSDVNGTVEVVVCNLGWSGAARCL